MGESFFLKGLFWEVCFWEEFSKFLQLHCMYLKQSAMASAAAVASSSRDALAISMPVKSLTMV